MTTFGLKAECGRFIRYDDPSADLPQLHEAGIFDGPFLHLGGGSNLLFTSGHFAGTVLHNVGSCLVFARIGDTVMATAAAGCRLDDVCREACRRGLWGMENLSGIPGNIGGAAVQNVGAYGTELRDLVDEVEVFDTVSGHFRSLSAEECAYGYRDSLFKHLPVAGSLVVTRVRLRLTALPSPRLGYKALADRFGDADPASLTPTLLRDAVIAIRDAKLPDPLTTGSAGSFFTNPVVSADAYEALKAVHEEIPGHITPAGDVKLSAAWLIDHAGCKSLRIGGAALWPSQPLVIVNATGEASGADVVALEHEICRRVEEVFGVALVPEVVHI